MKTVALTVSILVLAGCASNPVAEPPSMVRAAAPINYESAVTNYFDFRVRGPQSNRALTIGTPEPSDCVMRGGGGAYAGWVVPVIYSTTATAASNTPPAHSQDEPNAPSRSHAEAPARTATPARGSRAARAASRTPATATRGSASSHAVPSARAVAAADPPDGATPAATPTAALSEVSITGKSYFFWFSRETINAVTERLAPCP